LVTCIFNGEERETKGGVLMDKKSLAVLNITNLK
jgi:hypothetical protein